MRASDDPALRPADAVGVDLRSGEVLGKLIWLAFPVLVEQVLHSFAGLADTWIANHMIVLPTGAPAWEVEAAQKQMTAAGAAVSTVAYLLWFVGLVAGAVGTGSTAIIARATGARHRSLANSICGQSMALALLAGVAMMALVYALAGPIARVTGLRGEAVDYARQFLQVVSLGLPFMILLLVANACLRGAGDTVSPAVAMVIVDVVNIGVAFTLTFGWFGLPVMGFTGIAIGAVCGYVAGGLLQLIVLLVGRGGIRLFPHRLRPNWHSMRRLLRIGLPSGAESAVMWGVNFVLIREINRMDPSAASGAAHGVAVRVEAFSYLAGFAVAIAATTLVGQSLGMKNPRRAERAAYLAYLLGGGIMTSAGVLFVVFGRTFAGWMSNDPTVVNLAATCLFYTGFIQAGFAAAIVFGGSLRGAGDTLRVMQINLFSLLGVRLTGVLILTHLFHASLPTIWLLLSADLFLRGVLLFARFAQGGWKKIQV